MFDKLFLQKNYAQIAMHRFQGASIKRYSPLLINFRCPICGDSQKNKSKKRAYFIENMDGIIFTCHNECGSIGFDNFLKTYESDLYTQYKFDLIKQYKENKSTREEKVEYIDITDIDNNFKIKLPNVVENKKAYQYIKDRKIPDKFLNDIFYADDFFNFIENISPGKFDKKLLNIKSERIVLPMRDEDNELFGVVGRSLNPNDTNRYLTVKFIDSKPKMFGLERMNRSKIVRVVEGPIDSLFVDNCIALAGTDGNPKEIFNNQSDYVMILDNQPRSISVIKKYEKYIKMGCKMMIWPLNLEGKDINDLIISGMTIDEIDKLIINNTFSKLKLNIMFNQWRKI